MTNKISPIEYIFSKWGYKFLLFVVSYLLVALPATVFASIQTGWWIPLPAALIIGPIYFPYLMVMWFAYQTKIPGAIFILGWFSYIVIMLLGVVINNKPVAKTLYIIFVILLLLNLIFVLSMLSRPLIVPVSYLLFYSGSYRFFNIV